MQMSDKVAIFGAGGFAREVACILHDQGRGDRIVAFHEPDEVYEARELLGVPVQPQSAFEPAKHRAIVGIASPAIRQKVVRELPAETVFETLIHPTVVMSQWVVVGAGSIICAGCVLTCDISIGHHCHLNLNSTIGHNCIFGDFCTVAPGANISGSCEFGNRVTVGTQVSFRQNVHVCDDAVIGMGAAVVKDIVEAGTYVGVPARKVGS
jgi:sugar O-acyltransferase (sialic acid O-acetyltransferase NeuD family)